MNENKVYEITAEVEHLNIILKALSCYINVMYNGLDDEVVDVQKTFEDIKVCSDIQIVLKHALGKTTHSPKQTSENTNLIWCKEVVLPEEIFKLF
ncbi:MAG: hypothetical protein RSB94_08020 [Erysipelotrichaceae bacterium]